MIAWLTAALALFGQVEPADPREAMPGQLIGMSAKAVAAVPKRADDREHRRQRDLPPRDLRQLSRRARHHAGGL